MFKFLVRIILRYRFTNLVILGFLTLFMGYHASRIRLSYELVQMLPESDSTQLVYSQFKDIFGADGSVMFIGVRDNRLFEINNFSKWYGLTRTVKSIDGVQEAISVAHLFNLVRNDSIQRFEFVPVMERLPETQRELDSLMQIINGLHFYNRLLFNTETGANLMAITLDQNKLNTKGRIVVVGEIVQAVDEFSKQTGIETHLSGLPYIRTKTMEKVQAELRLFMFLSILIASVALYLFFRSFKAVVFPMIIVSITVVSALGMMSLFGYKITILTAMLPSLLIIIGVENCIFLLNKFHQEYRSHGNKVKALSRIVHRVGNATFLTNLTTATGFAAFTLTGNKVLVEFGVIASINIMVVFILSLMLIPIFFSYLAPPQQKHVKHLDNRFALNILEKVVHIVLNHRKIVYAVAGIVVLTAVFGVTRLRTSGNVVDDLPYKDPVYQDLLFFEREFGGVLPFEITINTHRKRGIARLSTIQKINQLQDTLAMYPEFSRPLSIAEVVKFLRQGFYHGNPDMFGLPNSHEQNFIMRYIPRVDDGHRTILNSFMDADMQITRISVQMANIGTRDIQRIKNDLIPKINAIFPPEDYEVNITGASIVFLKGTDYLVNNLITSLIIAIIAITLMMALLFTSFKMVAVSMFPNLLPQLLTAALMGFLAISIKPSTILIFSVALGISVDNSIHFLSRYRLELKKSNWEIGKSVISALRETGFSMIYSSMVLFFGFGIFMLSSFGGTEAMGLLITFTLLIALFSNLFVLPSLLLSLDKHITTHTFEEPVIEIFAEDDNNNSNGNGKNTL